MERRGTDKGKNLSRIAAALSVSTCAAALVAAAPDAPQDAALAVLTHDSAELSWSPVSGAAAYEATVWTNAVEGASGGDAAWTETFDSLPAGAATQLTAARLALCDNSAEWTDEAYLASSPLSRAYLLDAGGGIRIGLAEKEGGAVRLPHVPSASENVLYVAASAFGGEAGQTLGAAWLGEDGATNVFASAAVAASPEKIAFAIPASAAARPIVLFSANAYSSKNHRVAIDAVSFASGWSAGSPVPVAVAVCTVPADRQSAVFEDLPENAVVHASVAAVAASGERSEPSSDASADLSGPPEKSVLNAMRISRLERRRYSQDFDSLSAKAPWFNGATLPYWQAFRSGAAFEKDLPVNAGTATAGGFYSLSSSSYGGGCAFGALAPKGTAMAWGIAFTNDTGRAFALSRVSFLAGQWGFNNVAVQTLRLYVRVSDVLCAVAEDGDWTELSGCAFETPFADGAAYSDRENPAEKPSAPQPGPAGAPREASPSGVEAAPGQTILFRWEFAAAPGQTGSSAILGIDSVEIAFAPASRPFVVRIR